MQLKTLTLATALALLASGCSKPTDAIIPTDMSTWDKELAPQVQKLSDEDKALFQQYVMRIKLRGLTGAAGSSDIPFGTTVGQALQEQAKWNAEQKQAEEKAKAEAAKAEAEAKVLKEKMEKERAAAIQKLNETVTVTLLLKRELPKNYDMGRYSEYQQFVIGVENKSPQTITGVSGEIEFIDVFDKVVGGVSFGISEKIKPGGTYKWTGGRDYNQFIKEHRAVWGLETGKYTTRFIPEKVVFEDGTKLTAPE